MRYTLENGQPVPVTKIEADGQTITNPPDELIDELGLGFPKVDVPEPGYDPEEERVSFEWEIVEGKILKVWTITPLTPAEKAAKKNAQIDAEIEAVNAEYDAWQYIPIEYDFNGSTMYLKPIWITQYYGTLLQASTLAPVFPSVVTDAHNANFTMTVEQFSAMYLYLVQTAAAKIATVNAAIAALEAQKEVVNG